MDASKPTQGICELAASYALGALTPDETLQFRAHLDGGCSSCAIEVDSFSAVVGDLAFEVHPVSPPERLRTRLLQRIAAESALAQQAVVEKDGLLFARSAKIDWQALPIRGLEIKVLSADPQRGVATQLVRMQPGAAYPSHRHAGVEELFLLEGDLLVSGVLMRSGDYCRADLGSVHIDIRTSAGCLFISTNSIDDELIV